MCSVSWMASLLRKTAEGAGEQYDFFSLNFSSYVCPYDTLIFALSSC